MEYKYVYEVPQLWYIHCQYTCMYVYTPYSNKCVLTPVGLRSPSHCSLIRRHNEGARQERTDTYIIQSRKSQHCMCVVTGSWLIITSSCALIQSTTTAPENQFSFFYISSLSHAQ